MLAMSPMFAPVKASGAEGATSGAAEEAVMTGDVGAGGAGTDAPATGTAVVVVVVGATVVPAVMGAVTVVVVVGGTVVVVVVVLVVVVVVVVLGGFVVVVVVHAPATPPGSSAAITPATRPLVIRFMSSLSPSRPCVGAGRKLPLLAGSLAFYVANLPFGLRS